MVFEQNCGWFRLSSLGCPKSAYTLYLHGNRILKLWNAERRIWLTLPWQLKCWNSSVFWSLKLRNADQGVWNIFVTSNNVPLMAKLCFVKFFATDQTVSASAFLNYTVRMKYKSLFFTIFNISIWPNLSCLIIKVIIKQEKCSSCAAR